MEPAGLNAAPGESGVGGEGMWGQDVTVNHYRLYEHCPTSPLPACSQRGRKENTEAVHEQGRAGLTGNVEEKLAGQGGDHQHGDSQEGGRGGLRNPDGET